MPYGKALGTYRRINSIRRSSEKISEASSILNEQKTKAISEVRDLQSKSRLYNEIGQGVAQGLSVGMSLSGVNPEISKYISAGTHGVAGLVARSKAGGLSDEAMMGLGREGVAEYDRMDSYNPIEDAMSGYAYQQSFDEIRRQSKINKAIKNQPWEDDFGFTEEQLREAAASDPKFNDWESLPEFTLERMYNAGVSQGMYPQMDASVEGLDRIDFMKQNVFWSPQKIRNDIGGFKD